MQLTDADLQYLEGVHAPLGPVLEEMLKTGRAEGVPIVSPASGRLLRVLVTALAPKRVLEIGTAIGFSTLWMASALRAGGRIDTIDPDRSRTDRARRYWLRAGVTDRVRVINEPALRVLPRLAPGIEFAFIDAIKTEYSAYLDALLPEMRPSTKDASVSTPAPPADASGAERAIRAFEAVFLLNSLLPLIAASGEIRSGFPACGRPSRSSSASRRRPWRRYSSARFH